jgi:uncharacterized protein (DUF58 family)
LCLPRPDTIPVGDTPAAAPPRSFLPMNAPPPARFLDANLLRSIAGIELKARLLVEGMYASRHRSPDYGSSVEFVDHREYARGDEWRTIDWKMLARTERYYVKRFEMESNMNVVCLLDTSGSMGYLPQDKNRLSKLEYGSYLAAALSHLATHQQDAPGLVTFDTEMRAFLPPRQGRRHLFAILSTLESLASRGESDLGPTLRMIGQRLQRRGVIVLISDCHSAVESAIDGIRHLVARRHDVVVYHLLDADEVSFPFHDLTSFRDLETGRQLMSDPLRVRSTYLERLARFRESIQAGCAAAGADYRFVDTAEPLEIALRDYLLFRRQRAA